MRLNVTRRWLRNSIAIMVVVLILLSAVILMITTRYYYSTIEKYTTNQIIALNDALTGEKISEERFIENTKKYIENFDFKDKMELALCDKNNDLVISSCGSYNSDICKIQQNYDECQTSFTRIGRSPNGEKVIETVKSIYSPDKIYLGTIYCLVSLEPTDNEALRLTIFIMCISAFIGFLSILASAYFIKGTVNSLDSIGSVAKEIASGDFEIRLTKKFDDEIGGLCDTINDMAQELGKTEQLKNDFISSVSHELRTPLTAIKGWAETMKLAGAREEKTIQKGLGIIIKETGRLSGIVEELLDFSRMQNKKMVLIPEKMDILAELDEAVYMYNERALSEGKHIVLEAPESISPIMGDRNRLKQVFANLIDNSLKYTETGGLITVSVEETPEKIYIMIRDNGCGIPAEHLPRITDKFYKVNQTKRGSGIGLSIVEEIIKLHSGTLDIESVEGESTTVLISLPTLTVDLQ